MNEYAVEVITKDNVYGLYCDVKNKVEAVHQLVEEFGLCYEEDVRIMNATNLESEEADRLESDNIKPLMRKYETEVHTDQSIYYDDEEALSAREAEKRAVSKIPHKEVSYIERVFVREVV